MSFTHSNKATQTEEKYEEKENCMTQPRTSRKFDLPVSKTPCKYGSACNKKDCHFQHAVDINVAAKIIASLVDTPPIKTKKDRSTIPCRNIPCSAPGCGFNHEDPRHATTEEVRSKRLPMSEIPCKNNPCPNPKCGFQHQQPSKKPTSRQSHGSSPVPGCAPVPRRVPKHEPAPVPVAVPVPKLPSRPIGEISCRFFPCTKLKCKFMHLPGQQIQEPDTKQ
jgi:hypothetical protein